MSKHKPCWGSDRAKKRPKFADFTLVSTNKNHMTVTMQFAFTILNILDSFPSVQAIPEFSVCVAPTLSFFYQFLWILVLKLVHSAQEFAINDGTVCFTD